MRPEDRAHPIERLGQVAAGRAHQGAADASGGMIERAAGSGRDKDVRGGNAGGFLHGSLKEILFESKVMGTDDTGVKVLDEKLPFARTGRIWPYCGDAEHPVIVYDYTTTRGRAGPEAFLKGYRGYLQADAYGGYDAFFKDPARGLMEAGCWAHYLDSGAIQRELGVTRTG